MYICIYKDVKIYMHLLCEFEHLFVDPDQKRDGRLRTAGQDVGNGRYRVNPRFLELFE